MGRVSTGVIGMRLDGGDDEVVGMVCVNDPSVETIMVVSENGYGKRSEVEDYRMTNRGAKGVKTLNITDKTGRLVAIKVVTDENDLMIINKSGILIRLKVADVRVMAVPLRACASSTSPRRTTSLPLCARCRKPPRKSLLKKPKPLRTLRPTRPSPTVP